MKTTDFKTFDVRPNLARGEEPFPLIRARVDALTLDFVNRDDPAQRLGRLDHNQGRGHL